LSLKEQLGWIYFILPYISPVQNKFGLLFSILSGRSKHKIRLQNGDVITLEKSQIYNLYCLLGALCFATSYTVKSENKIEICQDLKNKFLISLNNLSYEDNNLLEFLFWGSRFGVNLVKENYNSKNLRVKTFRITQEADKKIIETFDGVKFYLDSISAYTIIETFVNTLHLINSKIDWNGKVVVDVGPEFGDTPLYFANLGAKVYAFEALKEHYDGMVRNLHLNPKLSKQIVAINAAIGCDEILDFSVEDTESVNKPGASFVYSDRKGTTTRKIKGYSLESAIKEFDIPHIDLLKMDCKGCEFSLSVDSLKNVDMVKIEHLAKGSNKLENLLRVLEQAGFLCTVYRQNLQGRRSNRIVGYVYGVKIKK
jgi:FkbM family methyltransferase